MAVMGYSGDLVLRLLARQWENNILCDLTIQTESGKLHPAHRNILSAVSPYFEAMLSGNFEESQEKIVSIKNVSDIGLDVVLKCVYTTKLDINPENICDVISTVHMLQFSSFMPMCEELLEENITVENCLQLLKTCESHALEDSRKLLEHYFMKHFSEVSETTAFLQINKAALLTYLSHPDIYPHALELDIYRAVIGWIKYDRESRINDSIELLSRIQMHHIPMDNLTNEVSQEELVQNAQIKVQFEKAMEYHSRPLEQPVMPMMPARGKPGIFTMVRNDLQTGTFEGNLYFITGKKRGIAKCHGADPTLKLEAACIVAVRNFVFVFGQFSDNRPFSQRYDASLDKWITLAPKPAKHSGACYTTAINVGDNIMIVGGERVGKRKPYDVPCLLYSIAANKWQVIESPPECYEHMLACQHNGVVYVTSGTRNRYTYGGPVHYYYNIKMWAWDPTTNRWLRKTDIRSDFIDGIFENVDDKLVIASDSEMEVYDPVADQWTSYDKAYPLLAPKLMENLKMTPTFSFMIKNKLHMFGYELDDDDDDIIYLLVVDFNKMEVTRFVLHMWDYDHHVHVVNSAHSTYTIGCSVNASGFK